jgi:hypothetical protein
MITAVRTILSDSKAVVLPKRKRPSTEVSQQPFDPAFLCGNTPDALGRILSRRDSSFLALPAGQSPQEKNGGERGAVFH